MRRPQSAFGLVAVMSSLLVVSLFSAPAHAAFTPAEAEADATPVYAASSGRCTKWTNQYVPPRTIRVLRTSATTDKEKIRGTVQEVDFFEYVATVMAAEWPEHYPLETLKAGAIATKQFAWYYILNPRGATKKIDGEKVCYDVVDSTIDQFYKPETKGIGKPGGPGPKIMGALEETWKVSLRKYSYTTKSSRLFLTGYRAGASGVACGGDATGWKLFHNSTRKCGDDGLKWREILRLYLKPNLEIVDPGEGNAIGTKHGDATIMTKDSGRFHTRVWTPGRTPPDSTADANLSVSTDDLHGFRSADMNGDGREDLVWLKKTGASSGKIKVALSNGTNYGEAQDWWTGDTIVPMSGARLLLGDFHASGRVDAAILGKGPSDGSAKLIVIKRKKYTHTGKFNEPVVWWSGNNLDLGKVHSVWTGDLSGDGRADLIVRQTPTIGGVRLKTAVTKSPPPSSGARTNGLATRWESNSAKAAKVKMVVGDANRDGLDDLLVINSTNGPAKIDRFNGQKKGGFKRVRVWTAPKSDPIPVKRTRVGTADVDYDGRADLVLYSERNNGKTRIRVLKTRYDKMLQGPNSNVGVPWTSVYPY